MQAWPDPTVFLASAGTAEAQAARTQSASAAQVDDLHAVVDAQTHRAETRLFKAAGVAPNWRVPRHCRSRWGRVGRRCRRGVPQLTLVTAYRQPPFPSQVPSCPQVVESTVQAPAEEPPDATGLQSPVAQVMHVPAQVVAQQIPETQLACVHWLLLLQLDPSDVVAAQVIADVQ